MKKIIGLLLVLFTITGSIYCWTIEEIDTQLIKHDIVKDIIASSFLLDKPYVTSDRKILTSVNKI